MSARADTLLAVDIGDPGSRDWQALTYFSVYRTVLAGLLSGLSLWSGMTRLLGEPNPELFGVAAIGYLFSSVIVLVLVGLRRPGYLSLLPAQVFLDIFALTTLMHASGGLSSGFGLLLVVAIAGGSILSGGRVAVLFAAVAALCVLAEQFSSALNAPWLGPNYPHAGMLGAAFFATAFLANYSANRLRESEALAAQQEADLADLGRLNEHIVQRMHSGIVVVERSGQVRLANKSAARLVGTSEIPNGALLHEISPPLAEVHARWAKDPGRASFLVKPPNSQLTMRVSFASLAEGRDGVLVFLEDNAVILQQAQQLKLASLGRLAGNIAHEIRNPLSAIAHANSLLRESNTVAPGDQRLMEIVDDNARRMNEIVESVLRMSRRIPSDPHHVEVSEWLHAFSQELRDSAELSDVEVAIQVDPTDLCICVDTGQIRQVLWNLCENGAQHAEQGPARIRFVAGVDPDSKRPFLDVHDDGSGIALEIRDQLFEPFFTTRTAGTGLGLYIARELCEANQATLHHRETDTGCCFRIIFADPRSVGAIAG